MNISNLLIIISPLIYIYPEIYSTNFWRSKKRVKKYLFILLLIITYFISRYFLKQIGDSVNKFYINDNYVSNSLYLLIFNIIDVFYWIIIKYKNYLKTEPILWRLIWFNFAEAFYIVIFSTIILFLFV